MCVSVCISVSFTVFIVQLVLLFLSFTYIVCLSVCLYVSCLCLWAMLPDLNKMMMIMMMILIGFTTAAAQITGCRLTDG